MFTMGIEMIKGYLPKDWEGKCRELKALQRSRSIKTAEDMLTLVLLYMTQGESLQITSALMKLSGISVNKNAVHERLKSSWGWLEYMAKQVCQENGFLSEKPEWLNGKKVCFVDGSDLSVSGSKGTDYRLHYMFDLFGFCCRHLELTESKQGERMGIFEVSEGDIVIGDRNFGNKKAMEYIKDAGAEFILRLKSDCFNIYDRQGEKVEVLDLGAGLGEWESMSQEVYYREDGKLNPVRVCVMKKGKEETEKSGHKQTRRAVKSQRVLSQESIAANEFIVVATNLPYAAEEIFELYRARWQIELVFKRLKSLFDLGNVPSKNPDSVKAWFYGKLLLAGICEASIKRSHFPPNG